MTDLTDAPTAEEAIAWLDSALANAEKGAIVTVMGAETVRAALELARDGLLYRAMRPNGYAVVAEEGAYCCELREDAVLELEFRARAGDELRQIFFGPPEPLTTESVPASTSVTPADE